MPIDFQDLQDLNAIVTGPGREIRIEKEGLQIRNSSFRNGSKTLNYSETSVVTD